MDCELFSIGYNEAVLNVFSWFVDDTCSLACGLLLLQRSHFICLTKQNKPDIMGDVSCAFCFWRGWEGEGGWGFKVALKHS